MSERIWIYQSDRKLSKDIQKKISAKTEEFLTGWQAHAQPLKARHIWMYDLFLILAVDEKHCEASGCSIDVSFQFIQYLEKEFGLSFLNRLNIAYINNGEIKLCQLNEIDQLIESGEINDKTLIFDNTISNSNDLENNWKLPISESWVSTK